MRLRRSLVIACLVATTAVAVGAPPSSGLAPPPRPTHEPVLFVHGWRSNDTTWVNWIKLFTQDGWNPAHLYTINYDTSQSNKTTAQQIAQRIDVIRALHPGQKVDVITHSMGGVSARWQVKFLGGTDEVDEFISLGGPNHGTDAAKTPACFTPISCAELIPGSSFLTALNDGNETPGSIRYATWWSPCDELILPASSTILSGARNTQTGCMEHIQLSQDPFIYQQVRDFVR